MISPELLVRAGLLNESEIEVRHRGAGLDTRARRGVDFGAVIPWKHALLTKALAGFATNATTALLQEFATFRHENSDWLDSFALYMALKDRNGGISALDWPRGSRSPRSAAATGLVEELRAEIELWEFSQWLFFRQWRQLREYARNRGIQLIGDAPIFAAMDSSDVWASPELFRLTGSGMPTVVAGVPPDYFAPTGQLWGNPIYDWEQHKKSGYQWWIRRIKSLLRQVDLVRLDHFRGFAACWQIPSSAPTAESGIWEPGPAEDLLDELVKAVDLTPDHPDLPLIAEDLGVATPDISRLLEAYGLPGMRVLQFGFTGYQDDFLPHNYPVNCVAYTGTHDNDTTRGWFSAATNAERRAALAYLRSSESRIVTDMMTALWRSQSALAIVPVQDILDLGSEARMNYPGRSQGFWEWRMPPGALTPSLAVELKSLNARWERLAPA
jgi:4-alpha-glucanotransferase